MMHGNDTIHILHVCTTSLSKEKKFQAYATNVSPSISILHFQYPLQTHKKYMTSKTKHGKFLGETVFHELISHSTASLTPIVVQAVHIGKLDRFHT